ncbi:MAG: plasmid pRiA4b ORF-3 family protein [Gaiellaceae bacterium]
MTRAYVFRANLAGQRGVSRTVAVRSDQTLDDLHLILQVALDWDNDHLYGFWLSGRFWDRDAVMYTPPFEPDPDDRSTDTRLDELGLEAGQKIAYVFDFGDDWRVRLSVAGIVPADGGAYPRILASRGEAPPQYPPYEADVA